MAEQKNEGEGSRTAARAYDREQQRFARSGKVEPAARDAEESLKDAEQRRNMEQAEREGRQHSHGEDPALKR